jgi:hypothetical protein
MDGSETLGAVREMAFNGIVLLQDGQTTILPPEMIRHLRPV